MKRALILAASFLALANIALPQPGNIGLFPDPSGLDCSLIDTGDPISVYVLHLYTGGASGSQFMVVQAGATLTYLGETSPFSQVSGDSQTGILVTYGACLSSPIHVLMIDYMGGNSPPCSQLQVVPDPSAVPQEVLVTDCSVPPNIVVGTGGEIVINPDETCNCDIPVEDTSWSRIKALYH